MFLFQNLLYAPTVHCQEEYERAAKNRAPKAVPGKMVVGTSWRECRRITHSAW